MTSNYRPMEDEDTDDELLGRAHKNDGTSSSEEEQEEEEFSEDESDEESDEEPAKNDHRLLSKTRGSLHSRHPWLRKWLKDGSNVADLLPEQYPKGFDPKRNESKWECFKKNRRGGSRRDAC